MGTAVMPVLPRNEAGASAVTSPKRSDAGTMLAPSTVSAAGAPATMASQADAGGAPAATCSGPIAHFAGELKSGVNLLDDTGERVNAHGGGIIKEGDTFYMHGEVFASNSTDNNFVGFSMYSSKDLTLWHSEGIVLPQQASGELGPNRKGERPHIIKCPKTGEFVLYAHAASSDYQTDKELVYATSLTVNGQYSYHGPLKNAAGQIAAHSDMSAYADDTGAYVLTEGWTRLQPRGRLPQLALRHERCSHQRRLRRRRVADRVQSRRHILLDRLVQDGLAREQQLLLDGACHERAVDLPGLPGSGRGR